MSTAIAAVVGALVLGGLVLVVRGALPRPVPLGTGAEHRSERITVAERWARISRRPPGVRGRRRDRALLIALVFGLVGYLATGWLLLIPAAPLLTVGIPYLLGTPPNREVELLGALDRWVRGLAATLPVGHSIADAIRRSVRTAPDPLADELRQVVVRMDQRWTTRDALAEMADRLGSPDADTVLAALALAAHRGGTGATLTLTELSNSISDRLKALRDIESERAKPRVVVRQVTVISVVVLTIALLAGGEFFAPYRTWFGQLLLSALVAGYVAALVAMRRMTAPPRRARILQRDRS
ncbi:hypothetical protein HJ590_13055 [Naumannella sp. ID2617S]|nr:hypothetical protein [Naumannella sp. ID2617S]